MGSAEERLASLPDETRRIVVELRSICLRETTGSHEMVYHGALGYSTSESPAHRICYVEPQSGYVNLGFFFGGDPPDPRRMGCGSGAARAPSPPNREGREIGPA